MASLSFILSPSPLSISGVSERSQFGANFAVVGGHWPEIRLESLTRYSRGSTFRLVIVIRMHAAGEAAGVCDLCAEICITIGFETIHLICPA